MSPVIRWTDDLIAVCIHHMDVAECRGALTFVLLLELTANPTNNVAGNPAAKICGLTARLSMSTLCHTDGGGGNVMS